MGPEALQGKSRALAKLLWCQADRHFVGDGLAEANYPLVQCGRQKRPRLRALLGAGMGDPEFIKLALSARA